MMRDTMALHFDLHQQPQSVSTVPAHLLVLEVNANGFPAPDDAPQTNDARQSLNKQDTGALFDKQNREF
jgi:hypothetical protein